MKLTRIHLDGFGALVEEDFEFNPALNVIFGPNEAGKSTLQQCVIALLFGFYQGDRISTAEKKAHARYRPWSNQHYGGSLYLRLDNGSPYLLMRRFDTPEPETKIFEIPTGKEVTDQFIRRRHGFVDFIERQTGMSRAVFEAVACVQQGHLTSLVEREAQDISDAITRLVDSAGADVSVRTVLDRLSSAIRTLGSDRSRSGPIFRARTALADAQKQLEERKILSRSLEADYFKANEIRKELSIVNTRKKEIEKDLRLAQHISLQNLLKRHAELTTRRQDLETEINNSQPAKHIPTSNRDVVIRLMEERKLLRQQRQQLYEELRQQDLNKNAARHDLETMPPQATFWSDTDTNAFFDLQRRWEKIKSKRDEIRQTRERLEEQFTTVGVHPEVAEQIKNLDTTTLDNLQATADLVKMTKEELDDESEHMDRRHRYLVYGRLLVLFVLLTLFSITIMSQFFPDASGGFTGKEGILNALKYIAAILALFWLAVEMTFAFSKKNWEDDTLHLRHVLRLKEKEMAETLAPFNVKTVEELLQLQLRVLKINQMDVQANTQIDELNEIELLLQPWLKEFQFSQINSENLRRIAEMLRQGTRLQIYITELEQKTASIEADLAQKDARVQEISQRLQGIFEAANCWTENLEKDSEEFLEITERAQRYDALMREWEQLNALEKEMLGDNSYDELREQLEQLKEEFPESEASTNIAPEREHRMLYEDIESQRQLLQLDLAALQERITERESQLPELSEIEENLTNFQAEIDALVLHRQALELAFETLTEVSQKAHQEFAPRLGRMVGRNLSQVTGSRYEELYIDPADFAVNIAHGKAKTLVPLEFLSFGTQEQIYLLLRAAVAQLFSTTAESIPLFLDDPLAHADEKRQKSTLELLAKIAESQQILYFTKDQSIIDTLAASRIEYNLIIMPNAAESIPYRWAAGTAMRHPGDDEADKD